MIVVVVSCELYHDLLSVGSYPTNLFHYEHYYSIGLLILIVYQLIFQIQSVVLVVPGYRNW